MNKASYVFESKPVQCRLCGSREHQLEVGAERYIDIGQSLYLCKWCGMLYLSPDLTESSLSYFYQNQYRKMYPFEASFTYGDRYFKHAMFAEVANERFKTVEGYFEAAHGEVSVLEVGSGYGAFLSRLSMSNYDLVLSAYEIDEKNREKLCDPSRIRFVNSIGEVSPGTQDFVFCYHVLEHLKDPVQMLASLFSCLKPGGRIIVEVPDVESDWGSWDSHIHAAHLSYFSSSTLEVALQLAGYSEVEVANHPSGKLLRGTLLATAVRGVKPSGFAVAKEPEEELVRLQSHISRYTPDAAAGFQRSIKKIIRRLLGAELYGEFLRMKFYRSNRERV